MLAVLVALIWGVNFVAADLGIATVPPLLFAAMRFLLVAVPAVFFVPSPGVGWRPVVGVGLAMSVGQFGLLYTALMLGMPAGLASLVLQIQAVLTVVLASAFLRERPSRVQLVGIGIGVAGLALVGADHADGAPLGPFLLVVAAAMAWATGNVLTRRHRPRSGFSLVVWSALVAPIPLTVASFLLQGPRANLDALAHLRLGALLAVAFVAYAASMVGYGLWTRLLSRHPASVVAPFSLLVPPVGILTAWLVQGEQPGPVELAGTVVITLGVLLTLGLVPGQRRRHRRRTTDAPADTEAVHAGR
jgi:O-acetylserine/cysteine efflux transporter